MTADSRRRTRLLAMLVLFTTFAAGALVGLASEQVLDANEPERVETRRGRGPHRNPFARQGMLAERLQLTEEQRAEIESILAADRAKTDSMFREIRPRLRARYDSTTSRIREVLTVEQQEEFDRYRQERRERVRRRYRPGQDDRRSDESR